MTSMVSAIRVFDNEIKTLSAKYKRKSAQHFLSTTALQRREALKVFMKTHDRLPHTMRELVSAKIAHPFCYHFHKIKGLPDRGRSLTVFQYLKLTKTVDDESAVFTPGIHMGSVLTLYLLRAVYKEAQPPQVAQETRSQEWASSAAEMLRQNGFTESQLELIRTDAGVRRALARLVRPAPRSP